MTTYSVAYPIFVRQGKRKTHSKVGYIDDKARIVIDPVFENGARFHEGLAAVAVRGRWGIIDTAGNFVIQPKMENWCRFQDGLAALPTRGKWGVIDQAGRFAIQPKYDYIGPFKEGYAVFRVGESEKARYGFLDKNGNERVPPQFRGARNFSEGLASVKLGNLWGYIVPSGVFKITPRFEGVRQGRLRPEETRPGYFVGGLAPVWSGDGYVFVDTTGQVVIKGDFDEASAFSEGRALIKRQGLHGFVEAGGKIVIETKLTYARDFSEGLAAVREKEWGPGSVPPSGFISLDGQMVIEPAFFGAENFYDGLCLVTTEDSIGYINKAGEFVWQGPYVEYGVLL
jgi:hypothetical protein